MAGLLDDALDGGAAYGFFPQLKGKRKIQDTEASADIPLQVLRGRLAGLLGLPSDIGNVVRSPMPTEMFGDYNYEQPTQLTNTTEKYLNTLPLAPTSRVGQLAGQAGSYVPLNPMPALRTAKDIGEFAVRGGGEMLNAAMMGENQGLLGKIVPQPKFLDVWHGSPHRFAPTESNLLGEFDASKIGTGEGAQAYGHGIYTGGNIKTGKEYVKTTARTEIVDSSGNTLYKELPKRKVTGESRAADALDYAFQVQSSNPYEFASNHITKFGEGPDVQVALKTLAQWEQAGAKTKMGSGYLYKADLPDKKIPQMLDWYYPVPEKIRQKISSAALEKFGSGSTGTSGAHLYVELAKEFERLGSANPKVDASEFLRQQGVPGIKYLDNFSRRQPEWIIESPKGGQNIFNSEVGALEFLQKNPEGKMIAPKQTYNYVMFPGEEKSMKILERN